MCFSSICAGHNLAINNAMASDKQRHPEKYLFYRASLLAHFCLLISSPFFFFERERLLRSWFSLCHWEEGTQCWKEKRDPGLVFWVVCRGSNSNSNYFWDFFLTYWAEKSSFFRFPKPHLFSLLVLRHVLIGISRNCVVCFFLPSKIPFWSSCFLCWDVVFL